MEYRNLAIPTTDTGAVHCWGERACCPALLPSLKRRTRILSRSCWLICVKSVVQISVQSDTQPSSQEVSYISWNGAMKTANNILIENMFSEATTFQATQYPGGGLLTLVSPWENRGRRWKSSVTLNRTPLSITGESCRRMIFSWIRMTRMMMCMKINSIEGFV